MGCCGFNGAGPEGPPGPPGPPGPSNFADPTAKVGLNPVNGSASTAMRSDAAPPIDEGISPYWTAVHGFLQMILADGGMQTEEAIRFWYLLQPVDSRLWAIVHNGLTFEIRAYNDLGTLSNAAISISRSGINITRTDISQIGSVDFGGFGERFIKSDNSGKFFLLLDVNNYVVSWTATNLDWAFDGDEDFATYPGYLAVDAAATSTYVEFNPLPASFLPWPRPVSAPYPFHFRNQYRVLTDVSEIRVPIVIDVNQDNTYSVNALTVHFYWSVADSEYKVELIGERNSNSFNEVFGTGLPYFADQTIDMEIVIDPGHVWVYVNGFLKAYLSGFTFPEVGYIYSGVQRESAIHQGMIANTEIFTQAPA